MLYQPAISFGVRRRGSKMSYKNSYEDGIYSSDMTKLGDSVLQSMQETIQKNGGVGTITGYFDADLSILSISDLLLHHLGYSYESLMAQTKGSLKKLFYGENVTFLENDRFRQIHGAGEGQILTADGAPVYAPLQRKYNGCRRKAGLGHVRADQLGV